MAEREPERAIEHLAAAAAADRFSPEPWQRLAAIELGDWTPPPGSDSLQPFRVGHDAREPLGPQFRSLMAGRGRRLFASRFRP